MKGEKTGGRKKGTPNRASAAKAKAIEDSGLTPLDFLLNVMRGQHQKNADPATIIAWESMRMEAAKAAAPFVHPKLANIDHKVDASLSVTIKQF